MLMVLCTDTSGPCVARNLTNPFCVTYCHVQGSILVKDDGRATITNAAAYTEACGTLYPYIRCIPVQESFVYQAPEFIRMDNPGLPTQAMDVYAFGSTLYAVRFNMAFFWEFSFLTSVMLTVGAHWCRTIPCKESPSYHHRG